MLEECILAFRDVLLWKERSPRTVEQPDEGTFTSPEGRIYTNPPDPYEQPPY